MEARFSFICEGGSHGRRYDETTVSAGPLRRGERKRKHELSRPRPHRTISYFKIATPWGRAHAAGRHGAAGGWHNHRADGGQRLALQGRVRRAVAVDGRARSARRDVRFVLPLGRRVLALEVRRYAAPAAGLWGSIVVLCKPPGRSPRASRSVQGRPGPDIVAPRTREAGDLCHPRASSSTKGWRLNKLLSISAALSAFQFNGCDSNV